MTTPTHKNILIVEDDVDILDTVKGFLESEGYDVQTAENGAEAMKQLTENKTPDLILLDMKMPIMNGWQFATEFHEKHDHTSPMIVMTAAPDAEQRAKDVSASGWVEKPFDLDVLLEKIKRYEK
jgi:DNA-binding response OmpR family regulator